MDKKLWAIWKYLSSIICLVILAGCSNSYANNDINCDLTVLTEHPVKECATLFEKKLATLSLQDKQLFEKEAKKIEAKNQIARYQDYAFLFKQYPNPKILFNQLQLGEKINKELRQISYDSIECCTLQHYVNTATGYDIIIAMLEKKWMLENDEKTILQTSKQRSQCLHTLLADLASKPDKTITSQEVTTKCFQ